MKRGIVIFGYALVAVLIITIAQSAVRGADASHSHRVPRCAEDEMLRGEGDFSHGKWTRYVCVHPEDVAAEMIENDYGDPTIYATVRGSVCEHRRFWKREVGIIPAVSETCN